MSSFVGSKGGAGVFQRIISVIRPHDVYVEPFVGRGAVLRHKRPARRSIAIDCCPGAIDALDDAAGGIDAGGEVVPGSRGHRPPRLGRPGRGQVELIVGDGVEYLRRMRWCSSAAVCVYADPPYVRSTRRDSQRDYYGREWTDQEHAAFCQLASTLPCDVVISGYRSSLYESMLPGPQWHSFSFVASTRGGPAEEWVWCNYPLPPDRLHDYRYLGETFPERWRIHKRQRSWLRMLRAMPPLERRAMLAAVIDAHGGEVLSYLGVDGRSTLDAGGGEVLLEAPPTASMRAPIDGNGDGRGHRRKRRGRPTATTASRVDHRRRR